MSILQIVFLTDLLFFSEDHKNLWFMSFGPALEKEQQAF